MQFYRRLRAPQVISFDLDDTLYNNVPIMQRAEAAVQAHMHEHYPATRAWQTTDWQALRSDIMLADTRLASNMTLLRLETLRRGFEQLKVANAEQVANEIMALFIQERSKLDIEPEALELLAALQQHYHVVAISNGNVHVPDTLLHRYFEHVWQPTEELRGKPHHDLFQAAMAAYPQVPAGAFLHVGDHPISDIYGAQRMGWQSAWFLGGLGRSDSLKVLPTLSFRGLNQLQQLLT